MSAIMENIKSLYPNGVMCRNGSNGNFLAVPDEVVDGVQTYKGVKVWNLVAKATEKVPAFDVKAASTEYEAYAAKQAAKASKPKASREPDPEKAAAKERRQAGLMEYVQSMPNVEFTSKDVFNALEGSVYEGCLIMAVGSDLVAMAKVDEKLTYRTEKGKKYWTYNA